MTTPPHTGPHAAAQGDKASDATRTASPGGASRPESSAFWNYWSASATSSIGDGIRSVALPLLAITVLQASNFEVSLITAASYAAIVLIGLPAGVLVQRFPLRRLQITMDVVRAVAILTIPLAAWWGVLTLPHVLLVAFCIGLASNLFDVANVTFVPSVVPKEQLTARNGLLSGTFAVTQLGGPSVGGLLVQTIGAAYSLVVDTVSYLISAFFLSRIRVEARPPTSPVQQPPFFRRIAQGLQYVVRHPAMRPSVLAATAVNFANGALLAVTAVFLIRSLDVPVGAVGFVIAADGVGALAGAALAPWLARRFGTVRSLLLATGIGALFALMMPLTASRQVLFLFVIGMAGLAAGVTVLSVITRTHRQTASPPELLARVMASVRFISWSVIPLGALVAGTLAQVFGPRAGVWVVAVAACLAPVAIWFSPLRGRRDLTDVGE